MAMDTVIALAAFLAGLVLGAWIVSRQHHRQLRRALEGRR